MTLETKERSSPFIHSLISFFHQYTSTEINFIVFGIIFLIHKSRSAEARYFNCHNLELVTRPLKAVLLHHPFKLFIWLWFSRLRLPNFRGCSSVVERRNVPFQLFSIIFEVYEMVTSLCNCRRHWFDSGHPRQLCGSAWNGYFLFCRKFESYLLILRCSSVGRAKSKTKPFQIFSTFPTRS